MFTRRPFHGREGVRKSAPKAMCGALFLIGVAILSTGCADWSYSRITLGQPRRDYEKILSDARQTALGLCRLEETRTGELSALVVLLTEDRRVAAKLEAFRVERTWGLPPESSFRLRGELDPKLYNTQRVGAFDTLRLITDELIDYRGEKMATDTHAWVASGLVRLLQRWPHLDEATFDTSRIIDTLERTPSGGESSLMTDRNGVFHFEYVVGERK